MGKPLNMFAARQRASCLARPLQRSTRSYASDSHHKAAEVNESFGTGSMLAVGSFFFGILVYQMTPRQGEESSITRMMNKYLSRARTGRRLMRPTSRLRDRLDSIAPSSRTRFPRSAGSMCHILRPFNLTLKGTTALDT